MKSLQEFSLGVTGRVTLKKTLQEHCLVFYLCVCHDDSLIACFDQLSAGIACDTQRRRFFGGRVSCSDFDQNNLYIVHFSDMQANKTSEVLFEVACVFGTKKVYEWATILSQR